MTVRRAAVAALAAGLLLAGCAGDPEPRFAEPTDPPSSPTGASTSAEPERQSAEEFIREWVALDTEMQNTGETDEYLAVSASCSPCRAVAQRIESIYQRGGHVETDGWVVRDVTKVPGKGRFRMAGTARSVTIVERRGAEETTLAGGPITYDFVLKGGAQGWRVHDLLEIAS